MSEAEETVKDTKKKGGKKEKKETKEKKEKKWVPKFGSWCYYELYSSNVVEAQAFYKGVFGWESKELMKDPQYFGINDASGNMIAGLMDVKIIGGAPPHWMPYVHSKNLEASIKPIEKAGGKVVKAPTEVPEHGRFAIIADPEGAHFALWQMKEKVTPTKDNDKNLKKPPTPFCWGELNVKDSEAALKFYKPALGWASHDKAMGPGDDAPKYHMFALKGERDVKKVFSGIGRLEGDARPHWLTYVEVKNADETVAKITELGGKIIKPAFDVPTVGRMSTVADPQGAVFAIFQPAPKSEKMDDSAAEGEKKRPSRGKGKKKEKDEDDEDEKPEKKEKKAKAPAKSRAKGKRKAAEVDDEEDDKDKKDDKEKDEQANGDKDKEGDKKKDKEEGDKKKSRTRGKKAKTE